MNHPVIANGCLASNVSFFKQSYAIPTFCQAQSGHQTADATANDCVIIVWHCSFYLRVSSERRWFYREKASDRIFAMAGNPRRKHARMQGVACIAARVWEHRRGAA